MRSRIFVALLFGAVTCAFTAAAADPALQAVFQRMDKAAASFKGCTADVTKVDHYAIVDNGDEKRVGTIAVRKPNPKTMELLEKFLPEGEGEQVELHGTNLEIYHPKTKLLQYDDIGKQYHGLVQEVMLVGLGGTSADLLAGYQVTMGGSDKIEGQAVTRLVLIPKGQQLAQQFPKFEVWYSDATGIAVQQKWYQKGLADYSVQTYSHMKIGPVDEKQVKLDLPKGVIKEHLLH